MKKTFFLLIIFILLAGGIYFFRFRSESNSSSIFSAQNLANQENTTTHIKTPSTISIPSLGVSADIEQVGLDAKRNMDVPKKAENAGWYNLGPKPGERGSAVLAGHLDDPNGNPAIFWNLKKIKLGEKIIITDQENQQRVFIVKDIENYPWNDFPLNEVFADATGKKLNLITCGGTWDKENKNYLERTVVYANLEE